MNPNNFAIPNQGTAPPYQNFIPQNNNQSNQGLPTLSDPPYAENILEANIGKFAKFYMSYSDSLEWRDRVFAGTIEAAGRDYAVVYDQTTGSRFVLWTVYLNYVEFTEPIILVQSQG